MALKKMYRSLGIVLLRIGCAMVRKSEIFSEDEKKSLDYHGVKHLAGVTAHYDDGWLSEDYPMTILTG
jgi:hypothetical protein